MSRLRLLRRLRRRAPKHVETYDARYFGEGRGSIIRDGESGYGLYTRRTSNADAAAQLVWGLFGPRRALDVGCAKGYVVEALVELGVDARGVDASRAAVELAPPTVRDRLEVRDLAAGVPSDESFELVTALEVLEHLPVDRIGVALGNLARVCSGHLVATIPSIGANDTGPDGWFEGKVSPGSLERYREMGADYDGPVPEADLATDRYGHPVEGHLTIASYRWWRQRFADAGFTRCPSLEHHASLQIARWGLAEFWCVYVMRSPTATERRHPAVRRPERIRSAAAAGLSEDGPQHVVEATLARMASAGIDPEVYEP